MIDDRPKRRPPIPAGRRGTNWECPHCHVRLFTLSQSWHLWDKHGVLLSAVEYSKAVYAWRREGRYTEKVLTGSAPACPLVHQHCPVPA